ncbi:MAG: starch synthase catalytic domain-containing protein, partial [Monoraphidium minutum]
MSEQKLKVVFVTTEVAPWSQVGGLGDVMAALPAALAARGHRVMTVAPRYESYADAWDTGVRVPVQLPSAPAPPTPAADAAAGADAGAGGAAADAYAGGAAAGAHAAAVYARSEGGTAAAAAEAGGVGYAS